MNISNPKIFIAIIFCFFLPYTAFVQQTSMEKNESLAKQYLKEGNKAEAARLYNQMAYESRVNGDFVSSIDFYEKVLNLNTELGNTMGQLLSHSNLSMLYIETEKYQKALDHLSSELEFRQAKKNPKEIIPVIISIAAVKNELNEYSEAANEAQKAIDMSLEINELTLLKRSYGIMYDIYTKWNKPDEAQEYFQMYSAIDKRIKDLKMAEVETEAKAKVDEAYFEKAKTEQELNKTSEELEKTVVSLEEAERIAREQQLEIDLQQAQINEKNALLKVEKLRKTYFAIGFAVSLVFILVLVLLVIRIRNAHKKINSQRIRLEKQNEEIRSSIRYAETIQTAMLPDLKDIENFVSHFVIYRPKDIVSGDFYWTTVVSDTCMYYSVVDCTGHGVPGAFMSMIGMRMLDEIVNEMKIESPAAILETLNELLRNALRQEQTDNNDGMDMAICKLEKLPKSQVEVTYSGAKRPLYIGRKSTMELEVFQPDRKSIGGHQPTKRYVEFSNQKVVLDKGDVIYIFSDGIVDQNNPHRKKFGRARLEDILKSCIDSDGERQKLIIEGKLNEFIQDEEQRDDITFSGLIIR